MSRIKIKSLKEYEAEKRKIFYFNEELFLGDPENFEAIIKYIRKNYDGVVLDTITAADVDVRIIDIKSEIVMFKDSGDYVFMVNMTKKDGGIIEGIYADLSSKIEVVPHWVK